MDRVKRNLAKLVAKNTQGTTVQSKPRWYEFGEKDNKYFFSFEKRNHSKRQIPLLKKTALS